MPANAICATMEDARELAAIVRDRVASELEDIDALVRNYQARVLRYVMFSVQDSDLADSITQDCFLKAWAGRESFRGECSVSTWLISIANNLVRDRLRTQKARFWRRFQRTAADVGELSTVLAASNPSPLTALLAHEQARQVQQALESLSANQRSIFLMRFSEEMELSEIASAMDMNLNTVKTHLHRAVTAVRSQMRNQPRAPQGGNQ
jgi:RNA polymerase sigma-70 factor (ECF subfamily)